MAKIELRFVQRIKDARGRPRYYFRRPGYPRVTLPGAPGSPDFMDAYRVALGSKKLTAGSAKTLEGSIGALFAAYYASTDFLGLKPQTQANYKHMLEPFCQQFSADMVADLRPAHIKALINQRAKTPGAAKNFRKRLRKLLDFAVDIEMRLDNPAISVKGPKFTGDGFRAWEDEDIELFETHWPEGTRARLALALLLYTGQRRSDVVRMGRQHIKAGKIAVTQVKRGQGQAPTQLKIPIHPKLKAAIDQTPATNLTFLMTAYGRPMSPAGFTGWFVECAKKAGLPDRSGPHGLRKAAARRLAEAGCSPHEIAAITGHRTLSEVAHYSKSANQERLAEAAMASISDKA